MVFYGIEVQSEALKFTSIAFWETVIQAEAVGVKAKVIEATDDI